MGNKKKGNIFLLGYKTENNHFDVFSSNLTLFTKLLLLICKLSKIKYEISLLRNHGSVEDISI